MSLLFVGLYYVLFAFFLLMWGRFIVDMVRIINQSWRPKGVLLVLMELVYTITDAPLRVVRRFIPPLRLGAVAFDLAWTVLLLIVIVLMNIVSGLARLA
ncbi:MAG: YggT family protein [Agromyces sp.]